LYILKCCLLRITPLYSPSLINLNKTKCSRDNLGPVPHRTKIFICSSQPLDLFWGPPSLVFSGKRWSVPWY